MLEIRRDDPGAMVFTLRIIVRTFMNVAVYGLLLFLPAWKGDWWRAWLLLALLFVGMIVARLWAFRGKEGLLQERHKAPIQEGQPLGDKFIVVGFLIVFPAYLAFIPLDVFRFHLLVKPTIMVSAFGLLLAVAGWFVITLAFRENAFASAIVKHQKERAQIVVQTGVYALVRHPLYSGVALVVVGIALWLQSYAAAIVSLVPITLLVLRIFVEEAHLERTLVGYDAYRKRVEHRVIPRIW